MSKPMRPATLRFRRCIRMQATALGGERVVVRIALEDDFHHFRVEVEASAMGITALRASAPRHPYSLCPSAAEPLQRLVGAALPAQAHSLTRVLDARQQCTHLLDLAGLACAHAGRVLGGSRVGALEGAGLHRRYDIDVPVRQAGHTRATLQRDGEMLLAWDIQDLTITGPAPYSGVELRQGMARWALTHLADDEAEAALVLRRGVVISLGKSKPLDAQVHAQPTGACYAQQAERAPLALRQVGSTWDFSARPESLCVDDLAWLGLAN